MTSDQGNLGLSFGGMRVLKDAPSKVIRQLENEAQALAVAMQAGGHKLASVAAAIGRSEGYVSRLRAGKRPIPDKLIAPLCAATGSNLLAQYRALQAALGDVCDVQRLAVMLRDAA